MHQPVRSFPRRRRHEVDETVTFISGDPGLGSNPLREPLFHSLIPNSTQAALFA